MPATSEHNLEPSFARELSGLPLKSLLFISFFAGFANLIALTVYPVDPWILRAFHLSMATSVILMMYKPRGSALDRIGWPDLLIAVLAIIPTIYITINMDGLLGRYGVVPNSWDIVIGIFVLLSLLEITRRTVGFALPIIALIFLGYCFLGPYMPGQLWHRGYDISRVVSIMFSGDAIYGIPLGVSASYVIMFIIFGSFLQVSGGLRFFIDLAFALTGRRRGGPAKVSLLASALMGTISGSAVGNVVTTGAFSIPLMKKVGYTSRFAGSVEAVASTGGQIMPPVMGAGAFIMADITGISYSTIAVAAIIPAFLYFFTIFWMVDFEAGRLGLTSKNSDDIPELWPVIKKGAHLITPLFVLLYCLIGLGMSPIGAGLYAIATAIVLSWFNKDPLSRLGPKNTFLAISKGFQNTAPIAATCATAGIVIGVFSLTGLGAQLSHYMLALAGDSLLLLLFLAMLLSIILGMGLPTVAAYAIAASTVAPTLVAADINPLSAHLFIFYFACLSTITPPVALSSFAAAAIAGANSMQVSLSSLKLGITAYVVPYLFVFGPELLMQGKAIDIIWAVLTACIGVLFLAASFQGWLLDKMHFLQRFLSFGAALLFMFVGGYTDVIAFLLGGVVFIAAFVSRRRSLRHKPSS